MEVIADGDAITILVNGVKSAYHVDRRKECPSGGHIALQKDNPETVVEFRKIDIKELNRWNQKDFEGDFTHTWRRGPRRSGGFFVGRFWNHRRRKYRRVRETNRARKLFQSRQVQASF